MVAILLGADNGFFYAGQIMHFSSPFTVFLIYHKQYVDSHERKIILHSLVELKNALILQGRYTDCVDELIYKVANAPVKRIKIEYV